MARGMLPTDLFRIQWVSDARLSPDGGLVVFTVTGLDEEADDYRSAIWMAPADGATPPRRFTRGAGKDSAPRWSPDGSRLAFLSDRGGDKAQVYVIDMAGGEAHQLTAIPQGAGAPVWSPDGTQLVTVVRTGGEDEKNQQDQPKTPPARVITTLKYRANGEGFTYDRRRHLFVVDAVTGETRQLTDGDWDDTQPAWSPDAALVRASLTPVRIEADLTQPIVRTILLTRVDSSAIVAPFGRFVPLTLAQRFSRKELPPMVPTRTALIVMSRSLTLRTVKVHSHGKHGRLLIRPAPLP